MNEPPTRRASIKCSDSLSQQQSAEVAAVSSQAPSPKLSLEQAAPDALRDLRVHRVFIIKRVPVSGDNDEKCHAMKQILCREIWISGSRTTFKFFFGSLGD